MLFDKVNSDYFGFEILLCSTTNNLNEEFKMKKISAVILMLSAASFYTTGYAESMSNGTTATQSQMMQSQMMTQEMTRDMAKLMQQLTVMTQDMDRLMLKDKTMDKTRTQDMARVMDQLSQAMHTMSQNMANGNLDQKTMREMEQHMNKIREMIKTMEQ
jgi:hypothetical protein